MLRLSLAAWLLLALTAVGSLAWSRHKLLSQDEIFVLQTDSVHSLRQLIQVQRSSPISLDPLVYHVVGHLALQLLPARTPARQAFALRLPSLLGFLLMQVCLYLFVRRSNLFSGTKDGEFAGERAAVLALALPALTASLFYAGEARPYGLLLGLCGLLMVSWQAAATTPRRSSPSGRTQRTLALACLAASLALALNTHYFAVLLLLPLGAAEARRQIAQHRTDWPMLAAGLAGASAILLTLPFQRAAGEFRTHYYNAGTVNLRAISQAYRSLLVDYTALPFAAQHRIAAGLALAALLWLIGYVYLLRTRVESLRSAELVFLSMLAALPFLGFALGRLVTHSFEPRYVLCALPGLSALLALTFKPLLSGARVYATLIGAAAVLLAITSFIHAADEREKTRAYLASLELSTALVQVRARLADQRIYVQNLGQFETARTYAPDPTVRSRITLLYSRGEELGWDGHDTAALTAMHLRRFTGIPMVTWEELRRRPGPHLLIEYSSGWDWTRQALRAIGAQTAALGAAFGGQAVLMRTKDPEAPSSSTMPCCEPRTQASSASPTSRTRLRR